MPFRVLHVIADGVPGGGASVVWTLCESLAARGIVSGIVTQSDSHLLRQARAAGMPAFGLDFSRRADVFVLRGKLRRLLARECPDVVHLHGARPALPLALLGRRQRPPLVYTVHGFHYTRKPPVPRLLARLAERICIARTEHTIFVADADRVRARQDSLLGSARYDLIYNGVAIPPGIIRPMNEREYDIAFVGRLHPQKDPLILPDILRALRPARPRMLIVAGGELERPLRDAIARADVGGQVTLMPPMPREAALRMMAQARIFLLPSLWEGLSMSLAEAMLLRVAVVASAIPGNAELVTEDETGLLAPAGEPAAFAAAIRRLLDRPADRLLMTERAAERAARMFSVTAQAEAHEQIFRSLAQARRATA